MSISELIALVLLYVVFQHLLLTLPTDAAEGRDTEGPRLLPTTFFPLRLTQITQGAYLPTLPSVFTGENITLFAAFIFSLLLWRTVRVHIPRVPLDHLPLRAAARRAGGGGAGGI